MKRQQNPFYITIGKRWLDLLLTIPGIVLTAPLLGLSTLLILAKIGRPVLFRQVRPGLHGKPFTIYKFRTMTDSRDTQGNLLPDSQRLTRLGRLLRATSLDELPELWNVLRGDMSLVGPRPLLSQYMERYTPAQARRHEVKPGLTGWAQVNGRNAITWDEKFTLDVWYVDNHSLCIDLKVILMTLKVVAKKEGVSTLGQSTTNEFLGSPSQW